MSSTLRSTTSGEMCMCVSNAPRNSSRARGEGSTDGCSATAECLGDVGEMRAHRGLGRVRVAGGDRIDDRAMLGVGALAATGEKDRPVLEADELRPERSDQPGRGRMSPDLEHPAMKDGVLIRRPKQVARVQHLAHPREDPAQVLDIPAGRADGRVSRRKSLEHGPRLEDLDGLALIDEANPRAAMTLMLDEALVFESRKCGPHG
jgi:hypothetical protein